LTAIINIKNLRICLFKYDLLIKDICLTAQINLFENIMNLITPSNHQNLASLAIIKKLKQDFHNQEILTYDKLYRNSNTMTFKLKK
jgi:hypothetical protein